jgi:glycosyltransferase involved in cell wall biosynthesis
LGLVRTVITPSEAVRRAVIEQFELAPADVVAVPLAARELFQPVEPPPSPPYLLFVGTLEERKNVARLIDAWRQVRSRHNIELWLVGRVRDNFDPPAQSDGLRYLGAVDDAELPGLYSGAIACVYPSHYEGFGLPVLEAMQCGCPVITSNDPAILEVSGDAVVHVDAKDTAALVAAMEALIADLDRCAALRQMGLDRAAQFSWSETARRTREVYAAACAPR